jgi:recombination DNA repair RAD52 pathway protein
MSTEIQVFNGDGFTQEQYDLLNKAMDVSLIKHRTGGGGQQLAYIKGKTAIDAANRIFGHGRWGYKVLHRALERTTDADGHTTSEFYTADIELYVVGNPFPFPGDGVGIVIPPKKGSIAEAHEKARKEAVTDALKRALRHYGSQFANDLYDEDALVDTGDGVMIPVKNTKNGKAQQNGRKTVDEHPDKISDQQKESIQKLCEMLNTPMPEKVNDLAFLEARELIVKLKEKYKEMKASQATTEQPAAKSNGHQAEPEPANAPATEQQLASIEKLCERLKKPAPAVQSFNQAREVIRQLTAELRTVLEEKKQAQPEATAEEKLASQHQIEMIRELHQRLGEKCPEGIEGLSYEDATQIILKLHNQFRESKGKAQPQKPAAKGNSQEASPTEQQLLAIQKLQKQLGIEPLDNLNELSFQDCAALLKEYSQQLKAAKAS